MKAQTQRRLRQVHHYLGVFFAPAVLFFAFSGLIQTIGWQDGPAPAAWISTIANLHKHQVASMPRRARPPAAPGAAAARPRGGDDHGGKRFVALKPFVLLVSIALFATTLLGVVVALTNRAMRRTSVFLLVAGTVVPLLLLLV